MQKEQAAEFRKAQIDPRQAATVQGGAAVRRVLNEKKRIEESLMQQ